MNFVLGISAFYHDSAATLIKDGKIISAVQEERFTRIKHDSSFPINSIKHVLESSNIKVNELDAIVFYEKPLLKFQRLIETYLNYSPKGIKSFFYFMKVWLTRKIFQKKEILNYLNSIDKSFSDEKKIFFSEHHISHAASAFFPSPFNEAIVLTADGVGELATTTVAIGRGNSLEIKKEIYFPHSLGLFYSAFTYFCGFKVNSGEYKLMGLAPYGKPIYKKKILDNLVYVKDDGSFRLNDQYFDYPVGSKMTNEKFHNLFNGLPRDGENEPLTQFHMDLAASIQEVTEEIILKICRSIKDEFKIKNLCLAGGVALNCVINGKILKEKIFDDVWVQPAAGDAGGSLGAALSYWFSHIKNERVVDSNDSMQGSFLGPSFKQEDIEKRLKNIGANFEIFDEKKIIELTSDEIIKNSAIGWFQGKMEFGPRSLGSRSIIANSRSKEMQKNLNLKIKYRESFRPFAPSLLIEDLNKWFELDKESPYMSFVAKIKSEHIIKNQMNKKIEEKNLEEINNIRSKLPAITHVDYSARIQTVHENRNKIFFNLLKKMKEKTGCSVVVNTSFNVRGEPIVNTPEDAFNCFMGTELDILVLGNCFLEKKKTKS